MRVLLGVHRAVGQQQLCKLLRWACGAIRIVSSFSLLVLSLCIAEFMFGQVHRHVGMTIRMPISFKFQYR